MRGLRDRRANRPIRPYVPCPALAVPAELCSDPAHAELEMPCEEAMTTQRAIRRLEPDPVDDALVLTLIELATTVPSGSNGQHRETMSSQLHLRQHGAGLLTDWRANRVADAIASDLLPPPPAPGS